MEFIKKQSVGFWFYLITGVLAIISLGVYIANVNTAYYRDMNTTVVILLSAAIVFVLAALILPQFMKNDIGQIVVDACRVGTTGLLILACTTFISMRVESFGYIFGSNLELGNTAATTAANQAVLGIVLMAVTWLISLLACIFGIVRKEMVKDA